jgi:acyl-coenzyme A synthetase/AMP-(fatty) acid ligase
MRRHGLSRFRTLFLAGERCDPDTLHWAQARLGIPVIDHWWQTETGWPIGANCVGLGALPVRPGSPRLPHVTVFTLALGSASSAGSSGRTKLFSPRISTAASATLSLPAMGAAA